MPLTFCKNRGVIITALAKYSGKTRLGNVWRVEEQQMTNDQKNEAVKLFEQGKTYRDIARLIGATPESVKQFFYRKRKNQFVITCEQCHQPIRLNSNRQHRFCSYSCRMKWWNHHPEEYSNKEQYCFCCKTCGKTFYSHHAASYCSRPCFYESRKRY